MDFKNRLLNICREKNFSGVVSIYKDGEEIVKEAFGYRDKSNKLYNDGETVFGIASGTKTFTSLGIIKLVESGVIDFDTKIWDIFDKELSFISPDATIKHLLCHTSGIYDYYDEELITDFDNFEVEIPWFKLTTSSDYYPLFENQKPKFAPGERYSYSNGGYVFLGIIIEKLSKMLYRDYMAEQLLKPVGMASSGFFAFNNLPCNAALGYIDENDELISNIYKLPIRGGGDGGMYTNAHDLMTMWQLLFDYSVISKESLNKMIYPETDFNETSGYGMGIYTWQTAYGKCYGAIGGDAGVGFVSKYYPLQKVNINVQSNMTFGDEDVDGFINENVEDVINL